MSALLMAKSGHKKEQVINQHRKQNYLKNNAPHAVFPFLQEKEILYAEEKIQQRVKTPKSKTTQRL